MSGLSIRTKIALFVLLVGLTEAIVLGVIGYGGVAVVSENSAELRRILSVVDGARELNVELGNLSDPVDLVLREPNVARERFAARTDDLKQRVASCAATACHGYPKRPPAMADNVQRGLARIRESGLEILARGDTPRARLLEDWTRQVDAPTRELGRTTGHMVEALMARAREIETSSRQADRFAPLLVACAALLCGIVAVIAVHPIARGIARPIEELAGASRKIAAGDLTARAGESGSAETAQLGQAFNRMMDDLAQQRAELVTHRDHLERTVEARVAELRVKDEEIRRNERLAGIGLIAGTVAHDLNNPLTDIVLNSELLLESLPEGHPGRALAGDIARSADRCRKISGEIRALSRAGEFEVFPCSVASLVHEAVRLLRDKSERRRIAITTRFGEGESLTCACNGPRFLQVLVNLLDNAVDASPNGAGVEVRGRDEADQLVLEIEDHGPGIPASERAMIFRPLHTTKSGGTGLGLAMSRRVVEQHGGTIEFETVTQEEKGASDPAQVRTIFRVRLPQRGPAAPANHEPSRHDPGC